MAITYFTGFEWPGVSSISAQGGGQVTGIRGTAPTVVSDFVRSGSYSCRIAPAASTDSGFDLGASAQVHVISFGLYFASLPSGAGADPRQVIFQAEEAGTRWIGLAIEPSTAELNAYRYDAGFAWLYQNGPVMETGKWYQVDCRILTNGTTWTVDYIVDGVPHGPVDWTGRAATSTIPMFNGYTPVASPGDFRLDDVVFGTATGDYPLKRHRVLSIVPSGAASHQSITLTEWDTTTDFSSFLDFTAQDESTSAGLLDDLNTTDGIRCAGTTGNPRWNLSDAPIDADPVAVRSIISVREASTGTNNAIIRIRSGGGTTSNIFSGNPGWGTTWNYLGLLSLTEPGGAAWTAAKITDLTLEADSTDAAPAWWMGGNVNEIAYLVKSLIWNPRSMATINSL